MCPRKLASSLVLKIFEHEDYSKDTKLPLHRTQCGSGKTGEKGRGGCVCVCETRQEAKKMQRRRLGERRVQKMSQQSWDKVQRKGNLKEEGEKDSARGK